MILLYRQISQSCAIADVVARDLKDCLIYRKFIFLEEYKIVSSDL